MPIRVDYLLTDRQRAMLGLSNLRYINNECLAKAIAAAAVSMRQASEAMRDFGYATADAYYQSILHTYSHPFRRKH